MSVLVEALNVIATIETINEKYPGGLAAYRADCPNATYCADDHLARVGFMTPTDVDAFIRRLERHGFVHLKGGKAIDVVLVDQHQGPASACDWIEGGKHRDGYSVAWLAGTISGRFAAPEGWTPSQSASMTFVPSESVNERLVRLKKEPGLEVILDLETGREGFIARTRPDETES